MSIGFLHVCELSGSLSNQTAKTWVYVLSYPGLKGAEDLLPSIFPLALSCVSGQGDIHANFMHRQDLEAAVHVPSEQQGTAFAMLGCFGRSGTQEWEASRCILEEVPPWACDVILMGDLDLLTQCRPSANRL